MNADFEITVNEGCEEETTTSEIETVETADSYDSNCRVASRGIEIDSGGNKTLPVAPLLLYTVTTAFACMIVLLLDMREETENIVKYMRTETDFLHQISIVGMFSVVTTLLFIAAHSAAHSSFSSLTPTKSYQVWLWMAVALQLLPRTVLYIVEVACFSSTPSPSSLNSLHAFDSLGTRFVTDSQMLSFLFLQIGLFLLDERAVFVSTSWMKFCVFSSAVNFVSNTILLTDSHVKPIYLVHALNATGVVSNILVFLYPMVKYVHFQLNRSSIEVHYDKFKLRLTGFLIFLIIVPFLVSSALKTFISVLALRNLSSYQRDCAVLYWTFSIVLLLLYWALGIALILVTDKDNYEERARRNNNEVGNLHTSREMPILPPRIYRLTSEKERCRRLRLFAARFEDIDALSDEDNTSAVSMRVFCGSHGHQNIDISFEADDASTESMRVFPGNSQHQRICMRSMH